jgi:hypothetical protein
MTSRRFPGPWRVEASEGAFIIKDASGFAVAYLYWRPQPVLHDRYMTMAEAAAVAEAIAKLPEILNGRSGTSQSTANPGAKTPPFDSAS